jgi:hypothetical protein
MFQFVGTHTVTRPKVGTPRSMDVELPFPGTSSLGTLLDPIISITLLFLLNAFLYVYFELIVQPYCTSDCPRVSSGQVLQN